MILPRGSADSQFNCRSGILNPELADKSLGLAMVL